MTLCRSLAVAAALLAVAAPRSLAAAEASAEPAAAALPGVDLEGLSDEQRAMVVEFAKGAFCYCGCPHTLTQCLSTHRACKHAPRMASFAVRLARAGVKRAELARIVGTYYASFDKRAKLDVSRFGPPLGSASAPVALVEFSDFTCPYCRVVRPALESFVEARQDRVKLFYKPFPIESHPGALEMSQAAEWAREKGLFWPMHDALFDHPDAHSPEDLADLARSLGGDPADLRAALGEGRHLPKLRESQAEARTAGIRGTPTLFLNGRMLVPSDFSEEWLEHTLRDEEEWQQHRGWQQD